MSACGSCSFQLWLPYGELTRSSLGLYSDARFPGRTILTLNDHYEQLDQVPRTLANDFMEDMQQAVALLKTALGSPRINVAILGNAEAHVHAHLIPRYPTQEPLPERSPWDDPRPRVKLEPAEEVRLLAHLKEAAQAVTPHKINENAADSWPAGRDSLEKGYFHD